MPPGNPNLGANQPKNAFRTPNLKFGSSRGVRPKIDKEEFARRVRERREELGLSQKDMQDLLGLSQTTYNNVETGKVGRPGFMAELVHYLATSPQWLWYGEPPKEVGSPVDYSQSLARLYELIEKIDPEKHPILMRVVEKMAGAA